MVMPDHTHLLVTLGDRTELSAAIRLFKGRLAPVLRNAGLCWQRSASTTGCVLTRIACLFSSTYFLIPVAPGSFPPIRRDRPISARQKTGTGSSR